MNPTFRVVSPCAMTSYRSLARAILDARRYRVPVTCGGAPVSWCAERVDGRVRLSAQIAGGAR